MPLIKGFTTKNPNWQDQIFSAIDKDPKAKVRLPFKTTNFRSKKNPLSKLKNSKIVDFEGNQQTITKVQFLN